MQVKRLYAYSFCWLRFHNLPFVIAILFHDLTQAQDLLLDPAKRSEYDQIHRSRQERKKKRDEMDSKRRNAQAELEQREKDAKKSKSDQNQAKAQYDAEIARMREEGAKRRQEDWGSNREKEQGNIKLCGSLFFF